MSQNGNMKLRRVQNSRKKLPGDQAEPESNPLFLFLAFKQLVFRRVLNHFATTPDRPILYPLGYTVGEKMAVNVNSTT